MEKSLKGAWILNLGKKINTIQSPFLFDGLLDSSKIGLVLQVLSSDRFNYKMKYDEVITKVKLIGINKRELDSILVELKTLNLIDYDTNKSEIEILGITNSNILIHTTEHFNKFNTGKDSETLLIASEKITNIPNKFDETVEELSDTLKVLKKDIEKYINGAINYNLIDLDKNSNYLYNGNIFRFDEVSKNQKILDSFSPLEKENFLKLTAELNEHKCLDYDSCVKKYTQQLMDKLIKVNLVDPNEINSPYGKAIFITLPSSFKRFSDNSLVDDVMDFAKAFLSSIYYGMNKSYSGRGKIDGYYYLLKKLLRGEEVGPATAICEDYRYLEIRGVVKIRRAEKYGCFMKLLKFDVGQIVFELLENGIITDMNLNINSNQYRLSTTGYSGPEEAKKKLVSNETVISDILESVRKG